MFCLVFSLLLSLVLISFCLIVLSSSVLSSFLSLLSYRPFLSSFLSLRSFFLFCLIVLSSSVLSSFPLVPLLHSSLSSSLQKPSPENHVLYLPHPYHAPLHPPPGTRQLFSTFLSSFSLLFIIHRSNFLPRPRTTITKVFSSRPPLLRPIIAFLNLLFQLDDYLQLLTALSSISSSFFFPFISTAISPTCIHLILPLFSLLSPFFSFLSFYILSSQPSTQVRLIVPLFNLLLEPGAYLQLLTVFPSLFFIIHHVHLPPSSNATNRTPSSPSFPYHPSLQP